MNQIGPTTVQPPAFRSCLMCQYHRSRMIRSGRNQEYDHYCKHPTSVEWANEVAPLTIGSPTKARLIRRGDARTPHWCPVAAQPKQASSDD